MKTLLLEILRNSLRDVNAYLKDESKRDELLQNILSYLNTIRELKENTTHKERTILAECEQAIIHGSFLIVRDGWKSFRSKKQAKRVANRNIIGAIFWTKLLKDKPKRGEMYE